MRGARRHDARPDLPDLVARLKRQARKLTEPRQAVLGVLRAQAHPRAVKEIFASLPPGLCDLATVYRCLHLLERIGMVKRYELGDGLARFELLGEGDDGHHHHLVCTRCSGIVEVEDCSIAELERRLAVEKGFAAVTHRLEFFGICPACQ